MSLYKIIFSTLFLGLLPIQISSACDESSLDLREYYDGNRPLCRQDQICDFKSELVRSNFFSSMPLEKWTPYYSGIKALATGGLCGAGAVVIFSGANALTTEKKWSIRRTAPLIGMIVFYGALITYTNEFGKETVEELHKLNDKLKGTVEELKSFNEETERWNEDWKEKWEKDDKLHKERMDKINETKQPTAEKE